MSACLFCHRKVVEIDYKDAASLTEVMRHDGTIRSRRTTRLCRKHQSQLATAVKRARFLALLPAEPPPRPIKWSARGKTKG